MEYDSVTNNILKVSIRNADYESPGIGLVKYDINPEESQIYIRTQNIIYMQMSH